MKWVKSPEDARSVDDEIKLIVKEASEKKQSPAKPDAKREAKIREFRAKVDGMCNRNYDAGFKQRSKVWVTHTFTGYFESPLHFKVFQKKYETFCGGYLWYYDSIIRNDSVDHGIKFNWKHVKDDTYSVTILMDPPAAPKISPNIPVSKKLKTHVAASLPDESLNVDPPKPPPPPPPEM